MSALTYQEVWQAARMAFGNYPDLLDYIEHRDLFTGEVNTPNDSAIRIAQEAHNSGFQVEWDNHRGEFQVYGYPGAAGGSSSGGSSSGSTSGGSSSGGSSSGSTSGGSTSGGSSSNGSVSEQSTSGTTTGDGASWGVLLAAGAVAVGAAVWWMGR